MHPFLPLTINQPHRDLPLPLPHTEPNFWWEVALDEEDGQFYFYPNTQNIRWVFLHVVGAGREKEEVCVCVC